MRRFAEDAARPGGWHDGVVALPAAPSPKRARLANSNHAREPPPRGPGPADGGAKRARELPPWGREPAGAPLPPRRPPLSPSPAAAAAGGAAGGGRAIDLTGESPQLAPAARRQITLSRANARVQGRAGGGAGAGGRPPAAARRSVVVIDDDSPSASGVESDDEGGRRSPYSASRGQRRREPTGAGGARAMPLEGQPPQPRRRDSAVVLIEGPPAPRRRRDKGKAPADERPAEAPAAVARADKLQIMSTVARPFTCPICYDDVEKGG